MRVLLRRAVIAKCGADTAGMAVREVVCIEGNIAVGKSTLLRRLARVLPKTVHFVSEPVEAWEACGALDAYYGSRLSALAFQQLALVTRDAAWRRGIATRAAVLVCERSVESDRGVFADALLGAGDRAIYEATYASLIEARARLPTLTVLLDLSVPELVGRLAGRNRASERVSEGGVGSGLLGRLQAAHERYYQGLAEADRVRVSAAGAVDDVAARVAAEIAKWRTRREGAGEVMSVVGEGVRRHVPELSGADLRRRVGEGRARGRHPEQHLQARAADKNDARYRLHSDQRSGDGAEGDGGALTLATAAKEELDTAYVAAWDAERELGVEHERMWEAERELAAEYERMWCSWADEHG